MKKYLLTATVMIGALLFAACGNTNKEADKKEDLTIVTTFIRCMILQKRS